MPANTGKEILYRVFRHDVQAIGCEYCVKSIAIPIELIDIEAEGKGEVS